jgi:hypothetical protein
MNKAVQEAVQDRDGAVHPARTYTQLQRRPGDRAILVSERATVFDRPRADLAPVDPSTEISDPIWAAQDKAGRPRWTPDLVHCRLLVVGEIITRMPGHTRKAFVSILGNLALSEVSIAARAPLSPAEITLADWTWQQLIEQPEDTRQLLQARAFELSFDRIAQQLRARGREVSKSTIATRYTEARRTLAGTWQQLKHPVDPTSFDRWRVIFQRAAGARK